MSSLIKSEGIGMQVSKWWDNVTNMRREKALESTRRLGRPLSPDWKFDREDANERRTAEDLGGVEDDDAPAVG